MKTIFSYSLDYNTIIFPELKLIYFLIQTCKIKILNFHLEKFAFVHFKIV